VNLDAFLRETGRLVRHHNAARWPRYDSFGRTTPREFVQPGVTVGAHDRKFDHVGFQICLEHLSDRAAVDFHRFKNILDSVLCEMAYRRRPGFQLGRRFLSQGFLVDPTLMHLIEVKGSPAPGRMH